MRKGVFQEQQVIDIGIVSKLIWYQF